MRSCDVLVLVILFINLERSSGIGVDVAWQLSCNQTQRVLLSEKVKKKDKGGSDKLNTSFKVLYPLTADAVETFNTFWLFDSKSPVFSFSLSVQSKDDQIQVIGNLKNISMASSKLLLAAKSLSVDPGAANAKNLLAVAARCDKTRIAPDMYHIFSSFVSICQ